MVKNDFDIDVDFEKEYGFDPKAFLDAEEYDENIDLSEFSDEELGLTSQPAPKTTEPEETADDFDLHEDLDLDDFLNLGNREEEAEEPESEQEVPEAETEAELSEEDDFDVMVFPRKREAEEPAPADFSDEAVVDPTVFEDGPAYEEDAAYEEEEPVYEETDAGYDEEDDEDSDAPVQKPRR